MRSAWLWCASVACVTLPSHATPAQPSEQRAEISLVTHVGQSTAPYSTAAFPSTSGYGASFMLSGRLRLAPPWYLGLRAPLVLMRVEQPAGALYDEAAWANPEFNVTFQQLWVERHDWQLRAAATLAIGIPLAEHDPGQVAGRALRLADAFEGLSEPGLYTPGIFPVTPGGSMTFASGRWTLSASLTLPLLFRVSGADLPPESHQRSFGFTPVATLEAQLRLLRWLSLTAAPRLTTLAIAPVEANTSPVQFLAAGSVDFLLGEHLSVSAALQAPVGGPLGGSTVAGGLRLGAAF